MTTLAIAGGEPAIKGVEFPQWPSVSLQEIQAVVDLLKKNTLSIYDRSGIYEIFENNFAKYHGVKYALSHNSGTSALHAAFFATGIGPGDEVLAPTYTFLATVMPIFQTGASPVLCEMNPDTLCIDVNDIERKITKRSKAIVITHMWGHPCEMDTIVKLTQKYNLFLIEDCSHGHGATYNGKKVGTFGDIGCFSLEGHKAVHAGEGGMFITDNRHFYERAVMLGHFGKRAKQDVKTIAEKEYIETGLGHKYRMHPCGATIANERLKKLDNENAIRKENMDWFSDRIWNIPGIRPPVTLGNCTRGGWYGYKPIYIKEELKNLPLVDFINALRAEGVPAKTPGSKPLHLLPLFQKSSKELAAIGSNYRIYDSQNIFTYKEGDFPIAEEQYGKLLSFPVFAVEAQKLLELFAIAIEKVVQNIDQVFTVINNGKLWNARDSK